MRSRLGFCYETVHKSVLPSKKCCVTCMGLVSDFVLMYILTILFTTECIYNCCMPITIIYMNCSEFSLGLIEFPTPEENSLQNKGGGLQ